MMWTSDLPWAATDNCMLYVMFIYNTSNPSTWIVLLSEYCWSLRLNKRTLKWQQLAIPKHMQFYFIVTLTPPTSGWITPPPNLRMEFHIPDMSTNRPVLCLMPSCAAVPTLRTIHFLLCFTSAVTDCKPALTVHLERSQVLLVQLECPKRVCMFLLLYFLFIFSTIQ
jgi:hypothetical protein